MTGGHDDRRSGLTAWAAVVALLILSGCAGPAAPGSGAGGSGASGSPTAATAPAPAGTRPAASASPGGATPGPARPSVLAASAPESLAIPAIGVRSPLLHLGLRGDGSLQVPPEPPGSPAGWYDGSPTPGERGPAVLLGHVNATGGGPGVFAGLRRLRPGDTVEVTRRDGTTVVFGVDRGEAYAKDDFPTLEVYGNTAGAELRLITCDGYDPATGTFGDNYVVYASRTA